MQKVYHGPPITPEEFTRRLGETLDFTQEDIDANGIGKLTQHQWLRLIGQATRPAILVLVAGGFILWAAASLAGYMNSLMLTIAAAASILAFLAGLARVTKVLTWLAIDIRRGKLEHIHGRLNPSIASAGKRLTDDRESGSRILRNYYLVVNGVKLRITEQAHFLLVDCYDTGLPNAVVYFTPFSRQVLSVQVDRLEENAVQLAKWRARAGRQKPQSIWKS